MLAGVKLGDTMTNTKSVDRQRLLEKIPRILAAAWRRHDRDPSERRPTDRHTTRLTSRRWRSSVRVCTRLAGSFGERCVWLGQSSGRISAAVSA